jgi:hypothetical protein
VALQKGKSFVMGALFLRCASGFSGLALAASVSLAGSTPALAMPSHVNEDKNGCEVNVQNPHFSQSHGGIDITATWTCSHVPSTVFLGSTTTSLVLWVCPHRPEQSEAYLTDASHHCIVEGVNRENIQVKKTKVKHARTAPPPSQPAAHGNGWWIACTTWYSKGPNGTSEDRTNFSRAVQLNG